MKHSIARGVVIPMLGILVLALVVVYLWTHPLAQVVVEDQTVAADPVVGDDAPTFGQSLSPPTAFPPLEDYHEIIAKPLFSATRRPPEVEVTTPKQKPPAEPTKATYILTGVLVTPQRRVAILKPAGGGSTLRVKEGSSVDGWRVESVKARSVVLKQGGQRQELKLRVITKKAVKPEPKRAARTRSSRRADRRRTSQRDTGSKGAPNTPPTPVTKGGEK